jgi:hypothetical protein
VSRELPDWPLIRQVVRIIRADPCGGLHREALAEMLHLPARGRPLSDALAIAYRNKKIDFCGQYAVKPVPVKTSAGSPPGSDQAQAWKRATADRGRDRRKQRGRRKRGLATVTGPGMVRLKMATEGDHAGDSASTLQKFTSNVSKGGKMP